MRREVDGNVPTLFYLARIAGVYFDPVAVAIDDTLTGNSTGKLDPGETASLWFTIRNQAVHPLDSAYGTTAKLVSLDTFVTVLDSVKSFPDVQRRSNVDNRADQFLVRASDFGQPGDTIPLRLEVAFTDAGSTIMMPVTFEVVLGQDVISVREDGASSIGPVGSRATVIGRVLFLTEDYPRTGTAPKTILLDVSGRRVMELLPGANDIRHLAPGVYIVRSTSRVSCSTPSVTKLVVQR
jgi:hypothetical protein